MDDKYSVSIVMPTHNKKDIVTDNIKKYLNKQDYDKSKYELIVVDDGSTDGTYTHLKKEFGKEISEGRLKVIKQNNEGVTVARNYGIANAKGNYICRADDDDPPLTNRLKDSIEYLKRNPDKRIVHAKSYWLDAKHNRLNNGKNFQNGLNVARERWAKHFNLNNETENYLIKEGENGEKAHKNVVHGGTTMVHKSLYDEIKKEYGYIYDPHLSNAEDKDLWVRIAKHAKREGKKEFGFLDKLVANYVYTTGTGKKEQLKQKRYKYIDGYINSKLNKTSTDKIIFSNYNLLNNEKLRFYLHKIGKRSFKKGERITYVFKDPDSDKYHVRRLDTDIITQKKNNFFERKMLDYDSLDELLEKLDLKVDNVEYVNDSKLIKKHGHLFKDIPFKYTLFNDINLSDKENLEHIKNADELIIHTNDNESLKRKLQKHVEHKKIKKWVPVRE